jgi:uncharacterized protein (DUF2126 family)
VWRPDHALAGYEDTFYYLWRERRLPTNVDPLDSRLDDEQERARLRRVFDQGLAAVVGYALPLRAVYETDHKFRWVTGKWFLRTERMYLTPGDSPMGYRLPLDSTPWSSPADKLFHHEADPTAPRNELPPRQRWVRQLPEIASLSTAKPPPPCLRYEASRRPKSREPLCA